MFLYHYTKIDAAISIIKNGLCFWGFRYDSMNDPTDYVFARDTILPQLTKGFMMQSFKFKRSILNNGLSKMVFL